ncbi:MAG: hypothetical protein HS113_15580 [Verrucomicrobiales bacterium]|nr:hypothetical protein [Verrucomicrobiales bacterium]
MTAGRWVAQRQLRHGRFVPTDRDGDLDLYVCNCDRSITSNTTTTATARTDHRPGWLAPARLQALAAPWIPTGGSGGWLDVFVHYLEQ